eukprot:CAMPEP_0205819298 /NCGR_PEP_ID=MMETSP0206-20130828/1610_1 /ASSEMBLY_ACC=CAM_ASM_000279 /TAXON_ID=36767 /ORGANISM="Euplotes focardii, Strain TN1" /LENGTH=152 /DNA_ID=CAMNT_0053112715 /DNA_START=62 /DNA_END=520 /DNA_ORIENTATION=-
MVAVGVTAVSLLFFILAVSLVSWVAIDDAAGGGGIGLWKVCIQGTCMTPEDVSSEFQATRAFVILSILSSFAATVCLALAAKGTSALKLPGVGAAFAAGLCGVISMAVFVDTTSEDIKQEAFSYGAAFALNIVAWIGCLLAGGLGLVSGASK